MNQNIFLATLGTSEYGATMYTFGDKDLKTTPYVQKAIIECIHELQKTKLDQVIIYATQEAKNKHGEKLKEELSEYHLVPKFVDIPEAKNTTQIWEIFSRMYDEIPENSHLFIDITHGFRYTPMLLIVLLPYSKTIKSIDVKGIYYGEYNRNAEKNPIIDLSSFYHLQEWTLAVHDFIEHGNPNKLSQLTDKDIKPILAETKGKNPDASALKKISKSMKGFYEYIETCRGKDITEAPFCNIPENIKKLEGNLIPAFQPLISKISKVFEGYQKNSLKNHEKAIQYCIEKGKIQQAATLLEEYCTSCIAQKISEIYKTDELKEKDIRTIISSYLGFKKNSTGSHKKWRYQTQHRKAENTLLHILERIPEIQKFAQVVDEIKQLRNDINQAGYSDNTRKYTDIKDGLDNNYNTIIQSLETISSAKINLITEPNNEKKGFLLNISNHAFANWSEPQKNAAISQFEQVKDLPFPNIPPEYTSEQISQMVEEWIEKINKEYPDCTAIHIMGEFNFTFEFVSKMKDSIPCYASTTERKVEMLPDGTRKMYFDFVQFRKY